MIWHGYFTIRRLTVGDANWQALIALVDQIQTNGDRAEYQLEDRTNLAGDAVNYEGRYNDGAVEFDKFAQKLATAFDVDVGDISINETQAIYSDQPTVKATYVYGGQDRFSVELMGCAADDDLCSWQQSGNETRAMMASQAVEWEAL